MGVTVEAAEEEEVEDDEGKGRKRKRRRMNILADRHTVPSYLHRKQKQTDRQDGIAYYTHGRKKQGAAGSKRVASAFCD